MDQHGRDLFAKGATVRRCGSVAAAFLLVSAPMPAASQDINSARERNIFVFTGRMLDADIGESLNVVGADYEDNYITGVGYQEFHWIWGRAEFGYELGAAGRYGDASTGELWGGLVARMRDISLGDSLFFSPSIVVGLSHVTDSHAGREQRLEAAYGGDAQLLFYLSPELDFKISPKSRYSFFWRLHHRSGAWNTLGDMKGAANANVFGVRVRF